MGSWRRRLRGFALAWGVLQVALPLAILFGDASSALAGSRQVGAHVEAAGTESCRPVHADECALCRFLSNGSAPIARDVVLAVPSSLGVAPDQSPSVARCDAVQRLPGARAPPLA